MKTIYPFMGLALCSVTAQAQEKPNFLIIQCDHLTQRVVGAYGHKAAPSLLTKSLHEELSSPMLM